MKKILFVLLILPLSNVFAQTSENKNFWELYEDRIDYVDYSKVNWKVIETKTQLPIPDQLKQRIQYTLSFSPEDDRNFNSWIIKKLSDRKITDAQLSIYSVRQVIELTNKIVGDSLAYELVDTFEEKKNLMECLMIDGKGDCDKYSDTMIRIFEWMRTKNQNIKNVFITRQEYAGMFLKHMWNTIFIFSKDRLTITQVDPTYADTGGKLEVDRNRYVQTDPLLFLATFYFAADEYVTSLGIYDQAYKQWEYSLNQQLLTASDFEKPNIINAKMWIESLYAAQSTYLHCQMGDKDKFKKSLATIQNIDPSYGTSVIDGGSLINQCEKLFDFIEYMKGDDVEGGIADKVVTLSVRRKEFNAQIATIHQQLFGSQMFELIRLFNPESKN